MIDEIIQGENLRRNKARRKVCDIYIYINNLDIYVYMCLLN